jgi:6-phosphogluconate dehydrogenase
VVAQQKIGLGRGPSQNTNPELVTWLEHALYFSMVTAYAQGMSLLQNASNEYKYGLDLKEVARIWRGGCIIRAAMLEDICTAFWKQPDLHNLLVDNVLANNMITFRGDVQQVIKSGMDAGIPMPAMMASLAYYDSYRAGWLPANLVQAQRDYFGAHTYERTDRAGIFHTQWTQK